MKLQKNDLSATLRTRQLNLFYEKPMAKVGVQLFLTYACIVFFTIVAIRPTLQTMAQLLKQIEEKRSIDTKLSQKVTALTSLQRQLSEKEYILPTLALGIPNSARINDLVVALEKLSSEHSITFSQVELQKTMFEQTSKDPSKIPIELATYPIQIQCTGAYENLLAFLRDLSNLKRIIVIDQFDILPSNSQDTTSLTLSVTVRAFSFQENKQL